MEVPKVNMLALITDAAPSANSSTAREVVDLVRLCEEKKVPLLLIHPSRSPEDVFSQNALRINCNPPFYKSKNNILRLVSELYTALFFSLKILITPKNKLNLSIIALISPSVFNFMAAAALKKKTNAPIYLILRDMFPFWLIDANVLKENGVVFKFLKYFADRQMMSADYIGVESQKSLEIFSNYYPLYKNKAEILWNWYTPLQVQVDSRRRKDLVKLIYAGSIGYAQGLEHFLALIEHWKNRSDVEVHFAGRGKYLENIISYRSKNNIINFYVHEEVKSDLFEKFLGQFDIGLFFLNHNIEMSSIPGKFMSYVSNGIPVLGSVNKSNELISIVDENNFGILDCSGDIKKFLRSADEIINQYKGGGFSKIEIQEKSQIYFSTSRVLKQILKHA